MQQHHNLQSEPETSTSMPSTSTINSLINAERIPSEQALGLNAQEASLLNFLRVDAAEKQRDRRFAHTHTQNQTQNIHYFNTYVFFFNFL